MGCVNVFLPAIYTWTGFWIKALVFNSQAEGQNFLRQTILYDYNNKSNKRQVKETVPTWSQNWLPPCNRKRCWCWERLKAGEGDDQGWDSWMASPTQWTWVWASSGSCWRTGRPGMLHDYNCEVVVSPLEGIQANLGSHFPGILQRRFKQQREDQATDIMANIRSNSH